MVGRSKEVDITGETEYHASRAQITHTFHNTPAQPATHENPPEYAC